MKYCPYSKLLNFVRRIFVLTRCIKYKAKEGNQIFHSAQALYHTLKLLKLNYEVPFRAVFSSFLIVKSRSRESRRICFFFPRCQSHEFVWLKVVPYRGFSTKTRISKTILLSFAFILRCTATTINCKRVHARGCCRPSDSSGVRSAPTRGCLLINEARAMCMTWIANNVRKTSLCAKGPERCPHFMKADGYGILMGEETSKIAV